MIDRADAEATIYRVAVCAFIYDPDRPVEETGRTLEEELVWCVQPLQGLDLVTQGELQNRIAELIVNPLADRQTFIADLNALVPPDERCEG